MIAYLQGTIIRKTDRAVVLNVAGTGYLVHIPSPLLAELAVGEIAILHIHTTVTESDIVLYGFATPDECTFFEQLISVSGIGSKTALNILSQPIGVAQQAILTEDIGTLTKIQGIGRKTAERLVVELKDKILPTGKNMAQVKLSSMNLEALEALLSLGFPQHEAVKMLAAVPADISDPREVVQYALKRH